MIVLDWLVRNPRCFKTYVGNRVSCIIELLSPSQWNHVVGIQNPADCASRGHFPSELLEHDLWWNGPEWLYLTPDEWPKQLRLGFQRRKERCVWLPLLTSTLALLNSNE